MSILGVMYLASTAYVVITSAARNGETAQAKFDRAAEIHAARDHELIPLRQAEDMLATARGKLDAACKGGEGKDCKDVKATIGVYEAAIKGYKTTLAAFGPRFTVFG